MTKKLFALVLAAMLAISMFTFPAYAAGIVANIGTDNTISYSWDVASGATQYRITIKNSNGQVVDNQTKSVTTSTNSEANCKSSYKATYGGKYYIDIDAYDATGINRIASYSTSVDVPVMQTGSGGVSISSSGNTTTVSWSAVSGVNKYYVQYTTADGSSGGFTSGTSFTISQPSSNLKSITVYRANDAGTSWGTSIGSWSNNGGGTTYPGGTNQYYGIGVSGVSNGYAYIYWSNVNNASYYVVNYTDAYGRTQPMNVGRNTNATVPVNANYVTYVSVTAYLYNGQTIPVGNAPISPYGTGSNTGYQQNLRVDRYSNSTVVSWNSVSNAHHYHIRYTSPFNNTTYDQNNIYSTSYSFNFGTNSNSWQVAVYAVSNAGSETYIGGATITPNGVNQSSGSLGNLGGSTSSGSNCSVTRRANDAYLTWNRINNNNNGFRVIYTVDGSQSQQLFVNSNAVTIPVGSAYTFTVYVYDAYTGQAVASGRFTGTNNTVGGGNIMDITKSEIEGVTVTKINSYTTKVSWTRTSNAAYYLIQYGTLDGTIADEQTTYNNYYDRIPFGESRGYFIKVFYWSNANSRFYEVGHAYNVPGSKDDEPSDTKNYPSEFKATTGTSKRVTLSWTAADGASYYNVYYKRATASKWIKIDKNITKTAVNVNGLTNGIDYQFKVVTNKGVESGVLKIAPSTTSKTVRAKDPVQQSSSGDDDDVSLDDSNPSVVSVNSNSKGSITVAWTNVGANSYRVYIAQSNSNSYKYCGTYSGTQATLSNFGSGSKATSFKSGSNYKVRVVRSDYKNYGTITTALQACAPLTVTVK